MSDIQELRYEANASFVRLLEAIGCSLAISVYMQNRVILVSTEGDRLHIESIAFSRPMGIAAATTNGTLQLAIATFDEVVIFADAPLLAPGLPGEPGRYRHLLVPRAALFTGDIDAHDLVWAGGRLYATNTRFSCIAQIDGRHSFTPVWRPPFVTAIMPEDRCHLNGLAVSDGRIAYATAFGPFDSQRGWRDKRLTSGLLMDAPTGNAVLEGLCMPHSPRLFDGQLYVLDSGKGRVLCVAREGRSSAETVAELPGFTRGLDHAGDVLFVGLSRLRDRPGSPPPVAEKHSRLVCGIAAVERRSGEIIGYLKFDDAYDEIFDVKVLQNFRLGGMLPLNDERHRKALVLPGRAFWAEDAEEGVAAAETDREN